VKIKENEFGSDWLKELALASLSAQGLEPAEANNTSELLGDTIIVSHLADKANLNRTGNGLSVLNTARIDESEEHYVSEGLGGESRDLSANDQENTGLQPEDPNVDNLVQIASKRERKDWGLAI
jgi:hypothetical protein